MKLNATPNDIHAPLALLGGLSSAQFMQDYWQKKPLLIRSAVDATALAALPSRADLLALAKREEVAARLVQLKQGTWHLTHRPAQLPSIKTKDWTLLVQGVDLHHAATHQLMQQFRFIPDARLDDAMMSFATVGGGVGPHFDSYDVFLLQTSGRRRWRIGAQKQLRLVEGAALKILAQFKPSKEYILEAGDMLYLPPRYAHEGVAQAAVDGADCITCSIGFRAPQQRELAQALLDRLSEDALDITSEQLLYQDPEQTATPHPAAIPPSLQAFADKALQAALAQARYLPVYLGEYLSEPKPDVWFKARTRQAQWASTLQKMRTIRLHPATRMLYDAQHIYINGESLCASGGDAKLMQQLANRRELKPADLAKASQGARDLLMQWLNAGWCDAI